MLREFITVNLTLAMVQRVGADQPQFRAALLASQLLGFSLSRYALAFDALTSASHQDLVAALGATLQHTCTAPLTALR
jgi:Tetracyclin repressor-like, C-terminal domain